MATITTSAGYTWQQVAEDRQKHRDATIAAVAPSVPAVPKELPLNVTSIPKELLTSDEIEITEMKVEDLVPALAEGKLSAVDVTNAFLRRAAVAQALVNCITELLPQKALDRAAFLDDHLKSAGKPVGALHGIPISVKEHVTMKGLDINAGFISWVGRVGEEDALILQILWDAGAVFYARTTEPQSLMHLETSSNIFGRTVNPFNTTLTAGGSSGGEGALVGLRGSCLGIGTDIGGSIRSPAANQGLWGFKGTAGRLPVEGWSATMNGEEQILGTIGPLSTSLAGCKLFVKTVVEGKPWLNEPSLLPYEWRDLGFSKEKKLKVAVLWDDGVVKVHPPVARALKELVEKLKVSPNVELVDWTPYKHDEAWEIIASLYFADGAAEELAAINASSEPILPLTKHVMTDNSHCKTLTISSLWALTARREAYRTAYAKLWNAADIDVILCPVGPSAAPKHETAKWWGYTSQWNLLNYPAIVFPVSSVSLEKDGGEEEEYQGRNQRDSENWGLWEECGAQGYVDAPISLQVVGKRFKEEEVFEAMEIIVRETGLGDRGFV